jgi:hypothetical protein
MIPMPVLEKSIVPFIFCHQKTNQKSAGGIVDFVLSGGFQSAGALPHLLPLIKPFPRFAPGPPVKNRKAKVRL